jgi:K+-transporting ATPase ATPase C chain
MSMLRPAVVSLALGSVLTGLCYPALVGGAAALLFPHQAGGSVITDATGRVVGSALVGQPFTAPGHLWGRPSATAPAYAAAASGGSNLGPSHPALDSLVRTRVQALRASYAAVGLTPPVTPIPVDLVTASGSGLDPHLSPAAARWQVARIAAARQLPAARVQSIVDAHTSRPWLGVIGEARVAVLPVNLALDSLRP